MYEGVNERDLKTIFQDSIITHSDVPVYVEKVVGQNLYILDIVKKKEFTEKVYSPNLDFTPVKLGMCNYTQKAFFLYRVPKRQYSQGLTSNSLKIQYFGKDKYPDSPSFLDKEIFNCILGIYPTYKETLNTLRTLDTLTESLAFSREFAIDANFQIFYKITPVGVLNEYNGIPTFLRNKQYLQEIFEEKIHASQ